MKKRICNTDSELSLVPPGDAIVALRTNFILISTYRAFSNTEHVATAVFNDFVDEWVISFEDDVILSTGFISRILFLIRENIELSRCVRPRSANHWP